MFCVVQSYVFGVVFCGGSVVQSLVLCVVFCGGSVVLLDDRCFRLVVMS